MRTRPIRSRRSELSTPASSKNMMVKAAASDADLVFLDLEDAVAPKVKDLARVQAAESLNGLAWGHKTRAVRVNSVSSEWFYDDLVHVVLSAGHNLDVVILPKIKSAREVWFVDTLLGKLEAKAGLDVGRIGLEVLIEEVEALALVDEIAASSPRLEALILGVGDLAASQGMRSAHIGTTDNYPGDVWHSARTKLIVAARVNGLDAVDGPYADYHNPAGYEQQAHWAAELGAVGKWAIHPSQIPLANRVFAPTAEEIAYADKVVKAVRAAEAAGEGAAVVDGAMVDAAVVRIFENVLDRASTTGLNVDGRDIESA